MMDRRVVGAVAALRRGGLVVLPTETVYGLAADASEPHAVARIYAIKGRPADHPLILHVASAAAAEPWVQEVPDYAERLMQSGWPGPLTVVLSRSAKVGDHVTGGQDTVAIRVPDHPLALEVLAGFDGAVAAPSANRFGHVSPTDVEHVRADLGDRLIDGLDAVLDGGPCDVGVESTIVDCTGPNPAILRPGRFGPADVERLARATVVEPPDSAATPRVSGSLTSHYAPRARVVLGVSADAAPGDGLMALASSQTPEGVVRLMAPVNADDYARRLYWALREADALDLPRVVAVPPNSKTGVAAAIRDRLTRASAGTAPGR